jgi:hypothetical protein
LLPVVQALKNFFWDINRNFGMLAGHEYCTWYVTQ